MMTSVDSRLRQTENHNRSHRRRVPGSAANTFTEHPKPTLGVPFQHDPPSQRYLLLQIPPPTSPHTVPSWRFAISVHDSTHVCNSTTKTATSSTRFNPSRL